MSRGGDMLDQVAFGLLLGLLILTPWPLGARLPWASMLAAAAAIGVGALWLASSILRGRAFVLHPLLLPMVAFLTWTGLQWAAGWTIYSHATAYEWVRYLSYAIVFALTIHLASDRQRSALLTKVIMAMAIAVGVFGLLQFLTWNGLLYWVYDPPYAGTRFGPFNNRNYFAGYMVAALAPAFGLMFSGGLRRGRALYLYLTWLAVLSLLMCLSRGGAIALAAVLGVVIALGPAAPVGRQPGELRAKHGSSSRRRWVVVVGIVFALLVGLSWLQQTDRVLARLETVFSFESETPLTGRSEIWRDSLPMVAEHPIAGFGLNTYGWAFPNYRQVPTSNFAMHAHNEYLEMLIETGIVGAGICLWFLVVLYQVGWRRLRGARDRWEYGMRLGALAGWTGILVYSLTDFPTIIPAIDYLLAILAALATMEIRESTEQ